MKILETQVATQIMAATQDVLEQGLTLLAGMDAKLYAQIADEPFGASVGGHYRHILDHFLCAAAGLSEGRIDYDHRSRNRELETSKDCAEQMTTMLIQSFRALKSNEIDRGCEAVYSVGYSADGPTHLPSSFIRELAFCVSHAIHHFAIIKLICAHLSVPVKAEFGVAPSTLHYRGAQAAS